MSQAKAALFRGFLDCVAKVMLLSLSVVLSAGLGGSFGQSMRWGRGQMLSYWALFAPVPAVSG